jgi:uncharacterized protein YdaU (DUF1376 family)
MSSNRPYMPLYIGAYRQDTSRLTTEEHGAYLLLLMELWNDPDGYIPDSARQLANIAGVKSLKHWHTIWKTLCRFFTSVDGLIRHKRIDIERRKIAQNSAIKSAAGKAGGRPKKQAEESPENVGSAKNPNLSGSKRETMFSENSNENNEAEKAYALRSRAGSQTRAPALPSEGILQTPDLFDSSLRSESLPEASSGRVEKEQDAEFEKQFWPAYPQKVGKGQARKAWRTARRSASVDAILAGLERYKRAKPPERDWRYPATWLNGEGWLDEIAAPPKLTVVNGNSSPSYASGFEGRKDRSALFERMREGTL